MVQYDRDFAPSQGVLEQSANGGEYRDDSSGSGDDEYSQHSQLGQRKRITVTGPAYVHHRPDYRQISPPEHTSPTSNGIQYNHLPQQSSAAEGLEHNISTLQQFHNVAAYSPHSNVRHNDQWVTDDGYSTANVSGVLEQLKIDDSGVGELNTPNLSRLLHC